ncbi:MAG TPA: YdcF family protein [Pseudolabrys sp.]
MEKITLMFFILSKTVAFFLLPSNLLIALAFIGLVLMATRWRRAGTRLMAGALVVLVLAAYAPLGRALGHALESRFPRWNPARGTPDGIVVLGGAINPLLSRIHGDVQLNESAERVTAIAKLARAYPKARIIYASGDGSLAANHGIEADYLYPLLDDFGIPRERVTLETRSRNTAENAAFSLEVAQPKPGERWLLVTSAQHMPRAIGCFRKIGFAVEAYPVDWQTGRRLSLWPNNTFSGGLARLDDSVHEWIGLIVYRLTDRTSELLPSP